MWVQLASITVLNDVCLYRIVCKLSQLLCLLLMPPKRVSPDHGDRSITFVQNAETCMRRLLLIHTCACKTFVSNNVQLVLSSMLMEALLWFIRDSWVFAAFISENKWTSDWISSYDSDQHAQRKKPVAFTLFSTLKIGDLGIIRLAYFASRKKWLRIG